MTVPRLTSVLADHLSSGGPAPVALAMFDGRDLEVLRALCRGNPARSRVAADGLAEVLARAGAHGQVIQNCITPSGGVEGAVAGAAGAGAHDQVIQNCITPLGGVEAGAVAGAAGAGAHGQVIQNRITPLGGVEGAVAGAGGAGAHGQVIQNRITPLGGAGAAVVRGGVEGARSPWRDALAELHGDVMRVVALEEELATFAPLLGVGWHKAGTALTAVIGERLSDLRAVLARAPELARVADLFGRQRAGFAKGLGAERGGRVTAVGVKVGGGLEDALPSELALLADPRTEDLFLMRLLERRLVSLELTGEEHGDPARPKRRRGPAIVLVDTSGSMLGRTAELAKALALAVVERLIAERRAVEVVLFGGEGAMKTTRFAERGTTPAELFDFLMASFHGGTDFNGPVSWALDRVEAGHGELERADLLLVTDGRARFSKPVKARLQAAQKRGLALYAAYVDAGLGFDPRGLDGLVDGVVTATPSGLVLREETR